MRTFVSVQVGFEFTPGVGQLEECDVAALVAHEAMPRGRVVGERGRARARRIGADATRVVGRVKRKVLVLARAQHPVVLERVEDACHFALMS